MRRDELMAPDLPSEIVVGVGGTTMLLFLIVTVIAALTAR